MANFESFLSTLSVQSQVRGTQFEAACRWYLLSDPVYSRILDSVWLWNEWPDRWGPDAGIDLVAETVEGDLWAIQAKAYGEQATVTKRDIDTFLSESNRPQFSFRLLIASTNGLSRNAQRVMTGQEKPVSWLLRHDLNTAGLNWPDHPSSMAEVAPFERFKPREHQAKAVGDVIQGFATSDRGQLIMACGTGKTLTALWIAEELQAASTLVLLPSLALLSQTLRAWAQHAGEPFRMLAVCSDQTVVTRDELLTSTAGIGVPVTTDPEQIRRFLEEPGRAVIFSTYQSSEAVAAGIAQAGITIDLVVADEAHHTIGTMHSAFGLAHDNERLWSRRRLYMTATPRIASPRVKAAAAEQELEVASMDDPQVYGPIFHRLSFSEAIRSNLLTEYRVVVVGVDDERVRELVEQRELVAIEPGLVSDAATVAAHVAIERASGQFNLHRMITFHSRVERARAFAESHSALYEAFDVSAEEPIWASYVSGDMPAGVRAVRLERLAAVGVGERGLLANSRCLGEGVDVPTLDGVVFVDPKRSQVDIVQAVGRAIRKAPSKSVGTIIVPVYVAPNEDEDAALSGSAFAKVWQVVSALRDHDDELSDALDDLRRRLGRTGQLGQLPARIVFDLPTTITPSFAEALSLRLVEACSASWDFYFGLLVRYVDENGNAWVNQRDEVDGFRLGTWVGNQRARRNRLTPRQVQMLETLVGWTWQARTDRWALGYELLVAEAHDSGTPNIAQSTVVDGFPLGTWANTQRTLRRQGDLSKDRETRLEAVEGWSWDPSNDRWHDGFEYLERFGRRNGHLSVPAKYEVDGFKLGVWVGTQRARHRAGILEPEREHVLEALPGWTWRDRPEWTEYLETFRAHVEGGGSLQPSRGLVLEGLDIGHWVSRQRRLYSAGDLEPVRAREMEEIPGWSWDPYSDRWEEGFSALQAYTDRHGHASPTREETIDGYRIGVWVASQRTRRNQGRMPQVQAERLEALKEWVWSRRRAK